jgi:hypothetical protein
VSGAVHRRLVTPDLLGWRCALADALAAFLVVDVE